MSAPARTGLPTDGPTNGPTSATPTPSRRTLLRTAAWTTPAVIVASAAPAFATSATDTGSALQRPGASCDVQHSFVWHRTKPSDSQAYAIRSVPTAAGVEPVTLQISTAFTDSAPATDPAHYSYVDLAQRASNVSIGEAIKFAMTKKRRQVATMRLVFTFSRPVTDLSFVITDIDRNGTDYSYTPTQRDRVWISAVNGVAPRSLQVERTSTTHVTGGGIPGDPFVNTRSQVDNNDPTGNVRVTLPGEVKTFSMSFENYADTTTGTNSINVGGMHFTTEEAVC